MVRVLEFIPFDFLRSENVVLSDDFLRLHITQRTCPHEFLWSVLPYNFQGLCMHLSDFLGLLVIPFDFVLLPYDGF